MCKKLSFDSVIGAFVFLQVRAPSKFQLPAASLPRNRAVYLGLSVVSSAIIFNSRQALKETRSSKLLAKNNAFPYRSNSSQE
jgi:hypothetical protein